VRRRLELDAAEVAPAPVAILARQDVPPDGVTSRMTALAAEAAAAVRRLAHPRAVVLDLAVEELATLLAAEAPGTPAALVATAAHRGAFFAVTLGAEVSARVDELFGRDEYAQASLLDAGASLAVERAVALLERGFAERTVGAGTAAAHALTLSYSPGYCGWPTTGLRALCARLEPADLGLGLGASCLMQPLKSCAGVLLAAPREAHRFAPRFEACAGCGDRTCGRRMQELASPDGVAS